MLHARSPENRIAPGSLFDLGLTDCANDFSNERRVTFIHVFDTERRSHAADKEFQQETDLGAPVLAPGESFVIIDFFSPEGRPGLFGQTGVDLVRAFAEVTGRNSDFVPDG